MTDAMLTQIGGRTAETIAQADGGHDPGAFTNVLVGVDGTSTGRDAIALAEMLRGAAGRLTLAHVVLTPSPIYGNFHSTGAGKKSLAMLLRHRAEAGVAAELTGMFASSVGSGLHQLARDCGADLLVVGSCSRSSMGRLLRGDHTQQSITGAHLPVAVAPHGYAEQPTDITAIGVGYDGTPEANGALAVARTLAARDGASLQALAVVGTASAEPGAWGEVDAAWGRSSTRSSTRRLARCAQSTASSARLRSATPRLGWSRSEMNLISSWWGRAATERFAS